MKPIWRFLIGQAVVIGLVVSLPWMVLAAVPALLEPTAPVLCPADQPDAYVVEYTTDVGDGVGTSSTLVCMGPGGDITEVGTWKPLALVLGTLLVAVELLVLPVQLRGLLRRRRLGDRPGPPRVGRTIQIGRSFG